MKNEFYFPLEVNLLSNKNVAKLIEKKGARGFGIYIITLIELRLSPNFQNNKESLKAIARRCRIPIKQLEEVLFDYNLFNVTKEEESYIITSPYINRVMDAYNKKIENHSKAGKINSEKAKRNEKGQFTIADGTIEEKRIEEKRIEHSSSTDVEEESSSRSFVFDENKMPGNNLVQLKHWEEYINQALQEESWMEVLAMKSGMGKNFLIHREWLIKQFRQHVILQGSEGRILSLYDAKSYLANFFRQGSITQKNLAEELQKLQQQQQQNSAHRFETIDPITGERSYYGKPIPPYAPPRPNDNAVWIEKERMWN